MIAESTSLLSIFLSGTFAGLVGIGSTFAVEKLGGAIGGVIATCPTTVVPASIGFITAAGVDADGNIDYVGVNNALGVIPLGMLINAGFLLTWKLMPPRLPDVSLRLRLAMMLGMSLLTWAIAALAVTQLMKFINQLGLNVVLIGTVTVVVSVIGGAYVCYHTDLTPAASKKVPLYIYGIRGLFCATSIALSVAIKSSGGDLVAGMVSVFPAIFLTTMVSLWLSHGDAVPCGAVGPMMLGSSAVSAYALIGSQIFPMPTFQSTNGFVIAIVLVWVLAVLCVSIPSAFYLRYLRNRSSHGRSSSSSSSSEGLGHVELQEEDIECDAKDANEASNVQCGRNLGEIDIIKVPSVHLRRKSLEEMVN